MTDSSQSTASPLDGLDEHTKKKLHEIRTELDKLMLTHDTRLLASLMAGRAARLLEILIAGQILTQEEAIQLWVAAAKPIIEPTTDKPKIVPMFDDEIVERH